MIEKKYDVMILKNFNTPACNAYEIAILCRRWRSDFTSRHVFVLEYSTGYIIVITQSMRTIADNTKFMSNA